MYSVTTTTYQSGTTAGTNPAPIPYPSGIQNGDLLFLFCSTNANGNITDPDGWTRLIGRQNSGNGYVLWKRATGSESGNLEVTINSAGLITAIIARVSSSLGEKMSFFISDSNYSGGTVAGQPITLPWEFEHPTLFLAAMVGQSANYNVTAYPTDYDLAQTTIKTNAGASIGYTASAVCAKEEEKLGTETTGNFSFEASNSGIRVMIAIYTFGIQNIEPNSVKVDEYVDTQIKIAGDISGGVEVYFDGVESDSVIIEDSITITALAPIKTTVQSIDVRVVNTVAVTEDTIEDGFSYTHQPPTIESVTPNFGLLNTSETFTITGENFRAGATVKINDILCEDIVVVNNQTITATYPSSTITKSAELIVENDDGKTATALFSYMEAIPNEVVENNLTATFNVKAIRYVE